MGRIDEIKERADTFDVQYFCPLSIRFFDGAEDDMRYLLDRIAKLYAIIEAARDEAEAHHTECECPLCLAVAALDNDDKETME